MLGCRRRGREVHGAPPGAGGNPLPRGASSWARGPLYIGDFRGGLCYLDAVEPEPRGPALKWCPFARIVERNTCVRSPGPGRTSRDIGVETALVQRVLMEQPGPFDVDVAEAALASQ